MLFIAYTTIRQPRLRGEYSFNYRLIFQLFCILYQAAGETIVVIAVLSQYGGRRAPN